MAEPKTSPLPPAVYTNVMRVAHTSREFFLTFAQLEPGEGGFAHLVSQLVTSPAHAKAMLRALEENVERYERSFGPIREDRPEPGSVQ